MSTYMLNFITAIIVIIGAFNWDIVGISNTNFVEQVFGSSFAIAIYILVGFAGLIQFIILLNHEQKLKLLV